MRSKKSILIEGDIYIKIKPDIIEPDKLEIQRINNEIGTLKGNTQETNYLREQLIELKKYYEMVQLIFDGTEDFHCIKTDLSFALMCSYEKNGNRNITEQSFEQIKDKYINILKFLQDAKYIGKEFRRIEPSHNEKYKMLDYMNENTNIKSTILYATDYAMLAQTTYLHGMENTYLEMINLSYIIDKKYRLIGQKKRYNEYDDKEKTYMKIYEEVQKRKDKQHY